MKYVKSTHNLVLILNTTIIIMDTNRSMACSDVTLNETSSPSAMSDIPTQPSASSMSDILEVCEKNVADHIPESPVTCIDDDALGQPPKPTVDNVCNLANLFSGELERRRKQEANKLMMKSKRRKRSYKTADPNSGDNDNNSGVSHTKKPALNYFVALQISNTKIKDALQKVQESIISKNQQLSGAVTKVSKLHITLMMLSLPSDEDMRKSQVALDNAAQRLLPLHSISPFILDISGLGHFGHQVVFAKVKKEDQLESLSNIATVVEESFLDQQIVSPDKKGFKPHATIMKMSQMKGWQRKGLKKIDADLYKEFLENDFGSDTINTLQLCALGKPKDKHGYYHVEYSALFGKPFIKENIADTHAVVISTVDTGEDTAVEADMDIAVESSIDATGVDTGLKDTVLDISVDTSIDKSVDNCELVTSVDNGKLETDMEDTVVDISVDTSIDTSIDTGKEDTAVDTGKVDTRVDTGKVDTAIDNSVASEDEDGMDISCTEVESESNAISNNILHQHKNTETDTEDTLPVQNNPTRIELE